MKRPLSCSLLLVAALLAGCANPQRDFDAVQRDVAARTGGKRLHWQRGGASDAEAQRSVQALLKRTLTADSAAQIALLNNRDVQAELEELGIARADYLQALLPRNPEFSFHRDFSSEGRSTEFSVVGEVIDLLLLPFRQKVASAQLERAKLKTASEVLSVVSETKEAFYTLQARQQLLGRLKLIATTNEASLDLAQRQHEAGNVTDLDLTNQQALYSQSKVDVARTQAQIRSDRERLNRLMGLWGPAVGWRVADQLPPVPKSERSLAGLEKRAVEERIDIALARQSVEAARVGLAVRSGTRFTPISIKGGIHAEKEPDSAQRKGPTVDVQLPLFDFGQAAIPKLQAQYRQAQHRLEALAVNARSEVREARDLVIANRDMARFYEKTLLPQRLKILNQTQLFYNAMQVGPIDLLAAKERELETERRYIEAWRDYWLARVQLERALIGTGGAGGGMSQRGGGGSEERGTSGGNSGATAADAD
jgi:cobalt-zinc-cadmium efflux system outer membrane protein